MKDYFDIVKPRLLVVFALLFLSINALNAQGDPRQEPAYKNGETIYKGKCASCHAIDEKSIGPPLAGVYDKYEREWLYEWIKNSQAMVKAGDERAVAIYNEYKKVAMTAFALSNAEIDDVLHYIKVETEVPKLVLAPNGEVGAAEASSSNLLPIFLGLLTLILFFVMLALARVGRTLRDLMREKSGKFVPERKSWTSQLLSKKFFAFLGMLVVMFLAYKTVESAQNLGRQQGYAPTQPIKFSHALHAGKHGIDCQFCHFGAAKGKSAVIPSANICMNCHMKVKKGPKYGETEIAKIYEAIGYDPATGYGPESEQKPIEWVRIHNLPDHVYFNHSQHVVAGGLECQTCHGPVEEMEVMRQHSSLSMGWCVNCHRQTAVKFDNEYYQVYSKYHEDIKNGKINQVTVDDIGGTECQKCHY